MSIQEDWLVRPTTPAEVDEELAVAGAPDSWLLQWRTLLGRREPGDEIWEYHGVVSEPRAPESADEIPGFELVGDSEIIDWIEESGPAGRIVEYHDGFALVRGGEIIDWIGAPP